MLRIQSNSQWMEFYAIFRVGFAFCTMCCTGVCAHKVLLVSSANAHWYIFLNRHHLVWAVITKTDLLLQLTNIITGNICYFGKTPATITGHWSTSVRNVVFTAQSHWSHFYIHMYNDDPPGGIPHRKTLTIQSSPCHFVLWEMKLKWILFIKGDTEVHHWLLHHQNCIWVTCGEIRGNS